MSTSSLNRLGHVGYALLFGGQALLAMDHLEGWLVRLAGEALWMGIGIKLKMNSIYLWGCAGIVVECGGFLLWLARG